MADRRLAALLFPIQGVQSDIFRFRFFRIREDLPIDNLLPIRMQRWADRLWRGEFRCPVYTTVVDRSRGFLVPSEALTRPGFPEMVKIRDVPDREYTVELTDQVREITMQQASFPERDLICRMLERPFTDLLLTKPSEYWRAQWTLFFPQKPANENEKRDVMNAFRGFKFGVTLLGDRPYLAIDIKTRYISRRALAEFSLEERESVLRNHLDLSLKLKDRALFLRDNGPKKIPCRYAGETGKTVAAFEFEPGKSVASYYAQKYGLALDPSELAVFVRDRLEEFEPAPAAPSSRLFPTFTTEFEGVRHCSVRPWMNPAERYSTAKRFLAHLSGARYGNRVLTISEEVFNAQRSVFLPPALEFGQGRVLEPFQGRMPRRDEQAFDDQVVRWGSKKYPMLLQAHPQHNEPLPDLVLLYPEELPREIRETFVGDLKKEIALQTGQELRVLQHLTYSGGKQEKMGGSLLRRIPDVKSLPKRTLALIVLSSNFEASVHGELKDRIRPNLSQCVMETTVLNIARQINPPKARSQVRNLALAVLVEAGVKPWVLARPLCYDAYIGIDLLYGRVAYHAFYGTGGRVTANRFGEAKLRGKWEEGIKPKPMRQKIEELVREMTSAGHRLGSLIVHRDGRWWPTESRGFRAALAHLQDGDDAVLPKDLKWAVVEIRKNHMPVRLFTLSGYGESTLLQNPLPGTYLVLDEQRVLLTTTGRPGAWDTPGGRTAGALLLQIAEKSGDITIEAIAEDAYRLTHLNWTSPDIEISLPVTIRWADESLRETLTPATDEEEEDSDEDEEDLRELDDAGA